MGNFTILDHLEDLHPGDQQLVQAAVKATANAYAPYSQFHVGTALLLDNGVIVTGANQENAAYPSCMCAERVAIYAATAQYPGMTIRKLAVVALRGGVAPVVSAASCGPCRQVMLEFEHRQGSPIEVVFLAPDNRWVKTPTAASLLPFAFSKDNL
ncbi:cytidine deaminase [Dawidia soli]|uniref:Cytidine deaminase n=1 Tax=Dawidia soli TaxID=2782352 RepID=A0AAP2GKB6_9BACT|nr:cytidine deaminase [Dawidia soli]MBT1690276.1 cytidine deaminase [Dawidia soli]